MKLDQFIKCFDAEAIQKGNVHFTFYTEFVEYNFWATEEDPCTREELMKHVMSYEDLAKIDFEWDANAEIEDEGDCLRVRIHL